MIRHRSKSSFQPLSVFYRRITENHKNPFLTFIFDAVFLAKFFRFASILEQRMYRAEHTGSQSQRFGGVHGGCGGDDRVGGIDKRRTVEIDRQRRIVSEHIDAFIHFAGVNIKGRTYKITE